MCKDTEPHSGMVKACCVYARKRGSTAGGAVVQKAEEMGRVRAGQKSGLYLEGRKKTRECVISYVSEGLFGLQYGGRTGRKE